MKTYSISYILILCLFTVSCRSVHDYSNNTSYTNSGYKNLYIVDTIRIEKPVSFLTKENHCVMTDYDTFCKLKSFGDEVIEKDGIFLYETDIYLLPDGVFELFSEKLPEVNAYMIENTHHKLCAKRFTKPIDFVLILVSHNYFNTSFVSLDGTPLLKGRSNNLYYKLLIPCELNK